MLYEFVTGPRAGTIGAKGNLVFFDSSDFDKGGSWYYTYSLPAYLISTNPKPSYTPISMDSGSRVTLGNTAGDYRGDGKIYNLRADGSNIQGTMSTVFFDGNGEFDFSPVTGNGTPGRVDTISPQTQIIRTTNGADSGTWGKYNNSIIPGSQDVSAYGVRSTGKLDVISDMSAQFFTSTSLSMTPFLDHTATDVAYIDSTSSNTSNAVAFRNGSMAIDNNFTGLLQSVNDKFYVSNYNASNLNSNKIGSYGIWSDGAVSITGAYRGVIDTQVGNVDLRNKTTGIKQDAAKTANVNNNVINSIGIQGTDITFESFDAPVGGTPSIHTEVDNVKLVATSTGGDGSSSSVTGNDINSIAINGANVTFNGKFAGHLDGVISNIAVGEFGGRTHTWTGNSYNLYGIRASAAFTANKNFDGAITLAVNAPSDSQQSSVVESNVYGIRGESITVKNGYIRSTITITVTDYLNCVSTTDYICGMRANTITAAAFDGTITVNSNRFSTVAVGLLADQSFANGNDESFDIIGDINVQGSMAAGILGSTGKDMNIRISGSVISNEYAVFAGGYVSNTGLVTRYNTNDRVEIAAGAYVKGAIELFNGRNSIVIDSNARIYGDVTADLGTNNVEIVLNDFAFEVDGKRIEAVNDDAILRSDSQIDSTVHFTINLNSVDLSKGGKYTIYSGNMAGWDKQILAFKYQGVSGEVKADGGTYSLNGLSVSSEIVNGEVIFTVNSLPTDVSQLKQVEGLKESFDHNAGTVTLSWDTTGTQGSYEVEYRIVGGKSTGKTVVQLVTGSKNTITLSNIEEGQKVEWRIRQNIGNGDRTSVWSDGGDVTMIPVDYVYSKVEDVDFEFSGFSAASAVANLTWKPGDEYSEGLKGYVVRYFQVKKRITGEVDWENTAVVTKYVTSPDLVASGLTNLQYFYWQVQAVDKVDKNGNWIINKDNWVDGEIFKVYDDDTTPPWFVDGQGAVIDAEVTWSDPTKIDPLQTHTMDPSLTWKSAEDDRSGVSRYTIRFRVKGTDGWTSCDIPVMDDDQKVFTFKLSEWLKKNPTSGLQLLENATYEWQLTAVDYSGQESDPLKGEWAAETKRPVLTESSVISTSAWDLGANSLYVSIKWDPATTEAGYSKVLRYEVQYRLAGSEDSWTTKVITVKDKLSWAGNLANQDWEYKLTAYNVAGNSSVSVNGQWLCDNVAPVFVDASSVKATNEYDLAKKTNTLTFTWSNATDSSATRPNSGVDRFELAYFDKDGKRVVLKTFAWDERKTLYSYGITVGQNGSLALADGYYKWDITAYDNAGNSTTVDGGQFLIDTTAPKGGMSDLLAHGEVVFHTLIQPDETPGRSPGFGVPPTSTGTDSKAVEVVTSIYVDFSFDSTYVDNASGVEYIIQICDNGKFTGNRLYEFKTSDTTLRLDGTNGFGAGCMANTDSKQVYWRVQAQDTMGNRTGNWYLGDMFYFIGENMVDYIHDVDDPTNITSTNVTVSGNNVDLGWSASSDIFGVEKYEIRYALKGGKTVTISVSAVDASETLTLADGVYSWSVRAVDYVGHTSAWTTGTSFEVDNTAPIWVNGANFAVNSTPGSKDIAFSWNAASDVNLAGYILVINKKTSSGYITQRQYIEGSKTTNYILYNQDDGDYTFTIYAYDSFGNISNVSNQTNATVNTADDAGNTQETAKYLPWGVTDKQTVGGTDTADWFTGTFTGAATLSITISDVANLSGKTSGIKLNIYNVAGKKVKSYTVKPGSMTLPGLLWDVSKYGRNYYVEIVSANKNTTAKYTIEADQNLFEAATPNVDFASAASITIDADGNGKFTNGWVGFGDQADYYKFTTAENGALTLNFTMRQQNEKTKYKVTLYNGEGRKVKSVTLKGDLGSVSNIFKKDVLALQGTYYLVVESGDKGKGKQNGYYDVSVSDDYFLDPNEVDDGKSFTISASTNTSISGWVGFGDASDSYLLKAGAGSYSISINNVTAKLKVTLKDAATGKTVKSWSVKDKDTLLFDHSLLKGDTYLVIESGDKGKGKQNSSYDVSIVANELFPKATNNNDLASATSVNFGSAKYAEMKNEWVGYGDDADFFSFQLDSASKVDLDLNLYNKGLQFGKDVKVKLYNAATGKTVKLDDALTTLDTLEAGKYAVSVEISKPEKNWTGYDLGITKLA